MAAKFVLHKCTRPCVHQALSTSALSRLETLQTRLSYAQVFLHTLCMSPSQSVVYIDVYVHTWQTLGQERIGRTLLSAVKITQLNKIVAIRVYTHFYLGTQFSFGYTHFLYLGTQFSFWVCTLFYLGTKFPSSQLCDFGYPNNTPNFSFGESLCYSLSLV